MFWRKPADMKYTDLCIWIDNNIQNIVNPGENPEIENTMYNYLWLLVRALAVKKHMFESFQDYDAYAFFAANRLYLAIRKNYWNQGKVIKGKLIRPIKSCLNYTKALLYPMKIEFQNETFNEILSEEYTSKTFDATLFGEQLKSSAISSQGINEKFKLYVESSFRNIDAFLNKVLTESMFAPNKTEAKNLKISILLNTIQSLKQKNRLDADMPNTIIWHLPKSMESYIKILLREFYLVIKKEIIECYRAVDLDDSVVNKLLVEPRTGEANEYED